MGSCYFKLRMKCKLKMIRRDKEDHDILLKRTVSQGERASMNIYIPNTEAPTFTKEKLLNLKYQINTNTIIVKNTNIPL